MPVDSKHKQYDDFSARWKRCRDAVTGEDAVKEAGELYLPPLGKRGDKDYAKVNKSYRDRAMFYNATGRTLQGIVGAIYRKPPVVEPESTYISQKTKDVLEQVLEVGRCGVLVDAPREGGDPYTVLYKAEDIINWRYQIENDAPILELVVLREVTDEPNANDPFTSETITRYRVLELVDGLYQQRVFKEVRSTGRRTSFDEELTVTPTLGGNRIGVIPFKFFSAANLNPDVDQPPLIDLVNVNLSHYRSSADLEHGRHFTALPTAWVAGFSIEHELRIGSGVAWISENPQARAGFLEFSGAGLGSIVDALREKEALMAVLGARLLDTAPRKGVETAEALTIRQSADTATASSIANNVSEGMTNVYQWLLEFGLETAEATVQLNTDLLDTTMSTVDVLNLVSAWQQGGISQNTMLWNFKRGEILPPDIDEEDEVERIALDMARFNTGPGPAAEPGTEEGGG